LEEKVFILTGENCNYQKEIKEKEEHIMNLNSKFESLELKYEKLKKNNLEEISNLRKKNLELEKKYILEVKMNKTKLDSYLNKTDSNPYCLNPKRATPNEKKEKMYPEIRELALQKSSGSYVWDNLQGQFSSYKCKSGNSGNSASSKTKIRYQLDDESLNESKSNADTSSNKETSLAEFKEYNIPKKRNNGSLEKKTTSKTSSENTFVLNKDSHRGFSMKGFMPITEDDEYDNLTKKEYNKKKMIETQLKSEEETF